ncbi:MAG: hypothetical protein CMO66_05915 [Verrucomicrobiales bacterium]|nr:hypothetical protein [Verrucomicrobiales bacterium]
MYLKKLIHKLDLLAITWAEYAAEEVLSGLTLEQFKAKVQVLRDAQLVIVELTSKFRGAIGSRRELQEDMNDLYLRIMNAVRGHSNPRIRIEMLRANGYKLPEDKASGLTRKATLSQPLDAANEDYPQDEAA